MNVRPLHFAFSIFCALAVLAGADAQVTAADRAKKSEEVVKKVRQLDLMNNLLPLVLTKEQLGKILPVIEKARAAVREQEQTEYDFLMKLQPKLDAALKEATEKGQVPGREVVNETWATLQMFAWKRKAVADENTQNVLKAFEDATNEGQRRTAINTLNPKSYDPNADPKTMSDKQKLEMFVRVILLDPLAYDLMVGMLKPR